MMTIITNTYMTVSAYPNLYMHSLLELHLHSGSLHFGSGAVIVSLRELGGEIGHPAKCSRFTVLWLALCAVSAGLRHSET